MDSSAPWRVVREQRLEAAVLEDQHEQAERGAEREQVHEQRLDRQYHRAGHHEQDHQRAAGTAAPARPAASRPSDACWSMNAAVPPPTRKSNGAMLRADVAHQPLAPRRRAARRRSTTSTRQTPPARRGGATASTPGSASRPRAQAATARRVAGARPRRRSACVRPGGNSRSSTSLDHARGAVLRQHARVDAGELDPQERQAHDDQQRGGGGGDRPGAAHHGL